MIAVWSSSWCNTIALCSRTTIATFLVAAMLTVCSTVNNISYRKPTLVPMSNDTVLVVTVVDPSDVD